MPGYIEDDYWFYPDLGPIGSTHSLSERSSVVPVRQKIGFVAPSQKPRYIVQARTSPIVSGQHEHGAELPQPAISLDSDGVPHD